MSDWDAAIRRHLASKPIWEGVELGASVEEYNRRRAAYERAHQEWNDVALATVKRLGITIADVLEPGQRLDSETGRVRAFSETIYVKEKG